MLEQLEHFDQHLLVIINSLHTPFFDQVMYALSGKVIWIPLYIAILAYIAVNEKKKFWLILLFVVISVLLADRGSVLIKNAVHRLRPCHEPALEGLVYNFRERCGGLYGFVSSHASNSFNVAVISLLFVRKKWFTFFLIFWALAIGFSRIYLGVHYPGDVVCGSIYGALVGWFSYSMYRYTSSYTENHIRKTTEING